MYHLTRKQGVAEISHLIYLCHHHISVTVPTIMSSAQTGSAVQSVKYLYGFVLALYSCTFHVKNNINPCLIDHVEIVALGMDLPKGKNNARNTTLFTQYGCESQIFNLIKNITVYCLTVTDCSVQHSVTVLKRRQKCNTSHGCC